MPERPARRERLCDAAAIGGTLSSGRMIDTLCAGWSAAGRDRILQAARAGRWEAARAVDLPTDADRARALVRDAGPSDEDVAVEFEWLGHPLVFVGARRSDDTAAFETDVVRVALENPADPARALTTLAGGDPVHPDHVELGAANAWRSVGPLRLWTAGGPAASGKVGALLADHPALERCAVPVALEVAFRGPRECWIGVEVSEPTGDGHVVAAEVVERWLERLLVPAP